MTLCPLIVLTNGTSLMANFRQGSPLLRYIVALFRQADSCTIIARANRKEPLNLFTYGYYQGGHFAHIDLNCMVLR